MQRRTVPLPLSQKVFDTSWAESAARPAAESPTGSWLVLTDGADTEGPAAEFVGRFGSATRRLITADISKESEVLAAFASTADDPALPPAGVIVFAGSRSFDGTAAGDALTRGRELAWSIAATVRAVIGGWHGKPPKLWVVSRNGLAVNGSEGGDPAIGGLKGLIRTLAYEHPDLHTTLVDIDGAAADVLAPVVTELESVSNDDIIAWRDGTRFAERLGRANLDTAKDPVVRPDGAYVVTGGLSGIGLLVTRWLVEHGAGRIILNARSQPSEEAQAILTELGAKAQIAVVNGDIADAGVAERLVGAAEETGLALRGIVHSAAVLDDQIVAALSRDSLEKVWAPKAIGALRLNEATVGKELDWWIGFSSTSSLLGSPGQAAYAAASSWLDGLVDWRRASGLPATTINWGQWSDIGLARELTFSALDPISPDEGMEAFTAIVANTAPRVGVARLRLDRAAAAFPEIQQIGFFSVLAEELDDAEDEMIKPLLSHHVEQCFVLRQTTVSNRGAFVVSF